MSSSALFALFVCKAFLKYPTNFHTEIKAMTSSLSLGSLRIFVA